MLAVGSLYERKEARLRKLLIAAFSLTMALGGGWISYMQLFHSQRVYFLALIGGCVFLSAGLAWFWIDILKPMLRAEQDDQGL